MSWPGIGACGVCVGARGIFWGGFLGELGFRAPRSFEGFWFRASFRGFRVRSVGLQRLRALGLVGFALQSHFQGFGSGFDVSKLYSQDPKVTVSLSPKTYNASPRK